MKKIPTLTQALLVGGTTVQEDVAKLRKGTNIIIATPGRLEDILSNNKDVNLAAGVKSLVIYLLNIFINYFKNEKKKIIITVICIFAGIIGVR